MCVGRYSEEQKEMARHIRRLYYRQVYYKQRYDDCEVKITNLKHNIKNYSS